MTRLSKQADRYPGMQKLRASSKEFWWRLTLLLVLGNTILSAAAHGQDRSELDLVNFAFGNYLGTGFYTSSSGEVFILKIPLSTALSPMTDDGQGWVINYPVTLGTANIDEISRGKIPEQQDVVTLAVFPGIEYRYRVSPKWMLNPFFDLGIARNFDTEISRRILGAGVKSFVTFNHGNNWLILGNRLLFANQESFNRDDSSNFAALETGLDYNIPVKTAETGTDLYLSFYYINYYYFKDLVLVDLPNEPLSLENKNEVGFTISLPKYSWLPDNPRLGFGVQITENDELYRLVFGAPFF